MTPSASEVFAGGGEMGALMRSIDWAKTPVGPVETWPQSLRTILGILLLSEQPMFLWWGPELVQFYNDNYRPMLGSSKHPAAMGQRGAECFVEAWDILLPMIEKVRAGGSTYVKDGLVPLDRNGHLEECYFSYGFTPVRDESGAVAGVFVVPFETTGRILGERRLGLLQELSIRTGQERTVQGVFRSVEQVLERYPSDLSFALVYEIAHESASLVACEGVQRGSPGAHLTQGIQDETRWPIASVIRADKDVLVENLDARFGTLMGKAWPEPVTRALLLPLSIGVNGETTAVLVAGLSPRLLLGMEYRTFLQLVARQVAASLSSTRAIELQTERAAALAELDAAKTAFFSNVSHELRTPLTLILGPVEDALAQSEKSLSGETLGLVQRNARRLHKLVNTLLDFSRIEAGRVEANYQPIDLSAFTIDVSSTFRSLVEKAGLTFTVDCPPMGAAVYVDREMYEKVVLNLLSNAFKFTLTGDIRVSLDEHDGRARLRVVDTGVGIPERDLSHVFERFYRVEGTRGRSFEGSGIGLALVLELAKLHGGSVSVESHLGEGSCFTVSLPLGKAHLPAERIGIPSMLASTRVGASPFLEEAAAWAQDEDLPPGPVANLPGAKVADHILLADDNTDTREYIRKLLVAQGWEVEAVRDGEAALARARARLPDLVVTDVMMPGLDGFGLLRALKDDKKTRSVPVILVSAHAGEAASIDGMRRGADDYLVKPFSAKELVSRVAARLEIARVRAESIAQLEKTRDFEQQLLGIVSHDLRNPLLTVLMNTTILLRQEDLDERAAGVVARIQTSAEGATRMVHDLLDFTRARLGGGIPINRQDVELQEVVRRALIDMEATFPGADARLKPEGEEARGKWDPDRLTQVVSNLVSNALRYSRAGSPVRVSTRADALSAFISIQNQGDPIPPEKRPTLFEPFQRATSGDATTRSVGLGLYIVKQIAEAHGGNVDVTSTEADGTTFTVRLPLDA